MSTFFSTTDLGLATILTYKKFPIKEMDKVNPKRIVFYFEGSKKLEKLVEDYWLGKLKVEPMEYFAAIGAIKSRIYQQ